MFDYCHLSENAVKLEILIYQDQGVSPLSYRALHAALQQECIQDTYLIRSVDRAVLQETEWMERAHTLIFPGGRDIPYHRALRGLGNRQIAAFVRQGGRFLGICAGAYYASKSIEFERGGPLEVVAERELQFFPGIARGPAYGPGTFSYQGDGGARIALLCSPLNDLEFQAIYHGGCTFIFQETDPSTLILAHYKDIEGTPPAILQCLVGKGIAILCGVHPEYSPHNPEIQKAYSHTLHSTCIEKTRRTLFRMLLSKLGLF